MKLLMDYDWPGNVRELENAVERAVVLSTQESMDADLLPESVRTREIVKGVRLAARRIPAAAAGRNRSRSSVPPPSLFEILEEVERRIIVDMLERTNWNQTEAAERFQIPLSTLNQKIKRLGIETRRRPGAPRGGPGIRYGEDAAGILRGKIAPPYNSIVLKEFVCGASLRADVCASRCDRRFIA